MISIICATNRPQNQTTKVVETYYKIVEKHAEPVQVLQMSEVPADFIFSESFGNRSTAFEDLVQKYIVSAKALVVIAPEYNGSYPGVFKAFLDANDPSIFKGKRMALVGVAAGRAGNLRGLDHLAQVAHHLGMLVLPNMIPISKLQDLIAENGELQDAETLSLLESQAKELIELC